VGLLEYNAMYSLEIEAASFFSTLWHIRVYTKIHGVISQKIGIFRLGSFFPRVDGNPKKEEELCKIKTN
jgi:hypothetical protein